MATDARLEALESKVDNMTDMLSTIIGMLKEAESLRPPPTEAQRIRALRRKKLVQIYEQHNPSKLEEVDEILDRYAGRETQMFEMLEQKYQYNQSQAQPAPAPAPAKSGRPALVSTGSRPALVKTGGAKPAASSRPPLMHSGSRPALVNASSRAPVSAPAPAPPSAEEIKRREEAAAAEAAKQAAAAAAREEAEAARKEAEVRQLPAHTKDPCVVRKRSGRSRGLPYTLSIFCAVCFAQVAVLCVSLFLLYLAVRHSSSPRLSILLF
jgi:hypothetical protein